jgi:hypothetical protein
LLEVRPCVPVLVVRGKPGLFTRGRSLVRSQPRPFTPQPPCGFGSTVRCGVCEMCELCGAVPSPVPPRARRVSDRYGWHADCMSYRVDAGPWLESTESFASRRHRRTYERECAPARRVCACMPRAFMPSAASALTLPGGPSSSRACARKLGARAARPSKERACSGLVVFPVAGRGSCAHEF